ncbi:MAG: hypothetical protein OEY03_12830, partial [Rhizobacter sp.]|nr:hypothetical protein [Rhizobacter sp.]
MPASFAGLVIAISLQCPEGRAQGPEKLPPADRPAAGSAETALFQRVETTGASSAASALHRDELRRLYRPGGHAPVWLGPDGRPGDNAAAALGLLRRAADEGLDPAHYRAASLADRGAALAAADPPLQQSAAIWDVDLSLAVLRYLRELHLGRVDPGALGFRVSPARHAEHDFAELLRTALLVQRLPQLAVELVPPMAQYRGLRDQLAHYRGLAADPDLAALPETETLRPGQVYSGLQALRTRL